MNPEWIGDFAACFTTIAYIPQAIKVFREKNTTGISLAMYGMITTGIGAWLVYGILIGSPSLILCNGISLVTAIAILIMKIKHG